MINKPGFQLLNAVDSVYPEYIPTSHCMIGLNSEEASMTQKIIEPLLDRKSAARYLRVSPGTLAVWDCTKRYDLKPIKIGRAVRYRRSDLDAFIEQRLSR
ncbi:helix-turn-helix domain-containing protein [Fibrella forsythiae]|nr:helix-turn-helix domain-containing protein [Fibrella forsythiae]